MNMTPMHMTGILAAGVLMATGAGADESRFAAALYGELAAKETGNLFFSPYSIEAALAMVAAGAAGETERQMAETLGLPADRAKRAEAILALRRRLEEVRTKSDVSLDIANRVWSQKAVPLLPTFTSGLEDTFGAGFAPANFAGNAEGVRREINGWVEKKTRDRIQNLIQPGILGPDTVMVLVNAIYFYGSWLTPFAESATAPAPFHLAGGGTTEVKLMHRRQRDTRYGEIGGVQVCELPYRGRDLVMTILLPPAGRLADLERQIAAGDLGPFLDIRGLREVDLYLPRFRMEAQFSLPETLKKLGIRDAFTGAADFSGMTGKRDLFLSDVIHKAFVEVNEKGTEAAAATAAVMRETAAPVPQPAVEFRADRPFVFAIRDRRSGAILFLGRLAKP
jgi:serpin B